MFKEHLFWKVAIITEIWNNILGGEGNITKVLKMQKRVLRVIDGLRKRESYRQVFKDLGISRILPCNFRGIMLYKKAQSIFDSK
jgi:hypothetical protein